MRGEIRIVMALGLALGTAVPALAAPSPSPAVATAHATRALVSEAVLAAVRTHMALAEGDFKAGRSHLAEVRRLLKAAVATSSPEETRELLEAMTALGALEQAVWGWDKKAVAQSRHLVDELLNQFDRAAARP
jgi:hypothetical protein